MVKKQSIESAKEKRKREKQERIDALEKTRKKSIILCTIFLFVLLMGVVDSQALFSFGIIQIDPMTLYMITGTVGAALAVGAFWSWKTYRVVTKELASINKKQ